VPDAVAAKYTRGTSAPTGAHIIASKLVVRDVPVVSGGVPFFKHLEGLSYRALLYELRNRTTGATSQVAPNWFGVAMPSADFDLTSDVYVIIYFHPTPGQAEYKDTDYAAKVGTGGGTDWKQLYAYVDRLGAQMAGAVRAGAPNNRITVFPFLKSEQYTLATAEWFNVIHDILRDINENIVHGICTRPKKIIVATLSNGFFYTDKFLSEAPEPAASNIIEAWDFDTDWAQGTAVMKSHGRPLRAYWQTRQPSHAQFPIYLPTNTSWANFPTTPATLQEVPPLSPLGSNSNADPAGSLGARAHHYIRDTMFLDAVWNIENDNP
jgi:hypothetical protein